MSKDSWQALGLAALTAVVLASVVWLFASWPPETPRGGVAAVQPAPQQPEAPIALVMGDSFAAGATLEEPQQAFPQMLAEAQGWDLLLDAQEGTGYLNPGNTGPGVTEVTGQVYAQRVGDYTDEVDVALFTGGYNDYWSIQTGKERPSAFASAVDRTLDVAEQVMPHTRMVVVGVWWPKPGPVPAIVSRLDTELRAAADAHDAMFVTGAWFHRADLSRVVGEDGTHPSEAGQEFIAEQLDARLS